jgi:DNA-binding MarR family transcriptional regulator
VTDARARAEQFADLFRAVYLTFHRRDGPRGQLPGASRAVLEHLALAGPLTVGEAAVHLNRAQSVISEIVTHLERQGLLEREDDPADRRRTLIWLNAHGQEALRRDREVLSVDHLATALARLPPGQADELIVGLRALVDLAASIRSPEEGTHDHSSHLRKLRNADRDRPLLRLLHRRDRCPAVVRRAVRADDRVAGTSQPRHVAAGDRAADPRLHGHHARLARPPAGGG